MLIGEEKGGEDEVEAALDQQYVDWRLEVVSSV